MNNEPCSLSRIDKIQVINCVLVERAVSSLPLIICYVHLLQAGMGAAVEAFHLLLLQSFQQPKSISVHTASLSQDKGSCAVVITVREKHELCKNIKKRCCSPAGSAISHDCYLLGRVESSETCVHDKRCNQ